MAARPPTCGSIDCNTPMPAALDTTARDGARRGPRARCRKRPQPAPALARARGGRRRSQSERRHIVIGGSRRLLEVTETARSAAGGTIGFRRRPHRSRKRRGRAVAPHQRARRGARKHPCRRRDLRPGQAAQILQLGLRQAVGHRGGLARRRARRSTSCWSACASGGASRNSPISALFKRQQLAHVHLADRAAAGADAPARRPHAQRVGVAASASAA